MHTEREEKKMQNFLTVLKDNLVFFSEFLGIVAIIFILSYLIERAYNKSIGYNGKVLTTKKLTMVGLFSAIATILMMFEVPLPLIPSFYKIDLSEVPILIVSLAYGPLAGALTEFCKILLKLVFRSTTTAFVGELANFVVGMSFILPATIIYMLRRTRSSFIVGTVAGTLVLTIFGSLFNVVYLLPKFAAMYGMPLDSIVAMGTALNPSITSLATFILFTVVPFNIIKGTVVSLISLALYGKLKNILLNVSREESLV